MEADEKIVRRDGSRRQILRRTESKREKEIGSHTEFKVKWVVTVCLGGQSPPSLGQGQF